jgi:outer membrane protein assembly factor BamB
VTNGDAPVKLWDTTFSPTYEPIIGIGRAGNERRAIVLAPYEKKLYSVQFGAPPMTLAWSIPSNAADFLIGADDVIYLVEQTNLVAVNPDGKELWRQSLPYSGSDIAIGVDSSLFVSIGDNLFRSAP